MPCTGTSRKLFRSLISFIVVLLAAYAVFAASQQVSSTSAQTIINNAKALLNGSDDSIFDSTEMLQWVNDGQLDIVSRSHCLQTSESVTLEADVVEYTIDSDYIMIDAVIYNDPTYGVKSLIPGSPSEVGLVNLAPISKWYEWAGKVGAYPPLSSVTTDTLTLYLVSRPSAIALADNITVPAIYDKALTYYVVAQALWKDRQTGRYAQMMQSYLDELMLYRIDLNEPKSNK